jgi:hypothetical protein
VYPDPVANERQIQFRADDDPGHRLRLEFSAGVEWRPILRKALEIWVPGPLRPRLADIEGTLVDLADPAGAVVIELQRDGDGLVAAVGGLPAARGARAEDVVVRRWKPEPAR